MSRRVKLMIGVVVFGVIMFGATFAYDALKNAYNDKMDSSSSGISSSESLDNTSSSEPEKIALNDFTVEDFDGNEVKFSDFKGKPVVINFWASWCPPCKEEMPSFQKVYDEYKDAGKDAVFMMIDVTDGGRETAKKAQKHIDDNGYTFPVYLDKGGAVYSTLGATGIPVTIFVDREGYVSSAYQTAISEKTLKKELEVIDAK